MKIEQIIEFNRETLKNVDCFITEDEYNNSPDTYGLPIHVRHLIDKPINKDLTYADLMMFLQTFFTKKEIKYVELGVSVLKTFFQFSSFLKNCNLYAFDINEINPSIAKRFDLLNAEKNNRTYKFKTNSITYFKGDVFSKKDFKDFKNLVGGKVNIIFSDACHTKEGLENEYENFIRHSLDDEFIIYYDDLDDKPMREAFMKISNELCSYHGINSSIFRVNGWLGEHEHAHLNGIITSLDFNKIIKENNINLK